MLTIDFFFMDASSLPKGTDEFWDAPLLGWFALARGLLDLGVAYESAPVGEEPDPEELGLSWDVVSEFDYDSTAPDPALQPAYEKWAAADKYWRTSVEPAGRQGLPLHKVTQSGRWWLLPEECAQAKALIDACSDHELFDAAQVGLGTPRFVSEMVFDPAGGTQQQRLRVVPGTLGAVEEIPADKSVEEIRENEAIIVATETRDFAVRLGLAAQCGGIATHL